MKTVVCCLLLLWGIVSVSATVAPRPLWTRVGEPCYVTSWLVCGPFFADRPALTLERDYAHGWGLRGEGMPCPGTPALRADGTAPSPRRPASSPRIPLT